MESFRIEATRGGIVESVHRVSVAVARPDGALVAAAGDPDLVTHWRSAAKPFQARPLVADGVLAHFGLGREELALACASHSSELEHLAVAERMLARIGCAEDDLACGPHPPLGTAVAREVQDHRTPLTPRWSNCSGKHAGMLALARFHGWPTGGYQLAGHPVQARLLAEVSRWTGVGAEEIPLGVDGCTTVCYALPVRAMALAYARLGAAEDPALREVRDAMLAQPHLLAGDGRLCTEAMRAWPGLLIAKVGAEGIYSAALPEARLGLTLKVEDGDMRAAGPALLGVLDWLGAAGGLGAIPEALRDRMIPPIRNTRGQVTGELRPAGGLRFFDTP